MSVIERTNTFSVLPESSGIDAVVSGVDLTVAQAADYLGLGENHLSDMLDRERIASRWENGVRLISQNDLLRFEEERERGHAALDELFRMFREAGMSDDYD